jgi:hypothetical protein
MRLSRSQRKETGNYGAKNEIQITNRHRRPNHLLHLDRPIRQYLHVVGAGRNDQLQHHASATANAVSGYRSSEHPTRRNSTARNREAASYMSVELIAEGPHFIGTPTLRLNPNPMRVYCMTERERAGSPLATRFVRDGVLVARFIYIGDTIRFTDGDADAAMSVFAEIQREMLNL